MLAAIAVFAAACAWGAENAFARVLVDMTTGRAVTEGELIRDIRRADIVFVGESHGNPDHHGAQLGVVKGLLSEGVAVSIGLEMFRASDQGALDAWVAGFLAESDFVPVFDANWGGEVWAAYSPIFRFAREKGIPMVGLNVDPRDVRRVSREGFSSLQGKERIPIRDVKCDVGARYREILRQILERHARRGSYDHFCEAQVLRDASMAWNLVDYLGKNPGRTVVVLAGNLHSWKHGIPARVRQQSSLASKVILPSGPDGPFGRDLTREDADYLWRFDGGRRES